MCQKGERSLLRLRAFIMRPNLSQLSCGRKPQTSKTPEKHLIIIFISHINWCHLCFKPLLGGRQRIYVGMVALLFALPEGKMT